MSWNMRLISRLKTAAKSIRLRKTAMVDLEKMNKYRTWIVSPHYMISFKPKKTKNWMTQSAVWGARIHSGLWLPKSQSWLFWTRKLMLKCTCLMSTSSSQAKLETACVDSLSWSSWRPFLSTGKSNDSTSISRLCDTTSCVSTLRWSSHPSLW